MSNICLQNTRYKLKSVSTSLAGITEAGDHMKASSNSDENSSAVKVTRTSQLTNCTSLILIAILDTQKKTQSQDETTIALHIVCCMGIKSKATYRTYNTVCVLKDLRRAMFNKRIADVVMTLRRAKGPNRSLAVYVCY